MQDEREKRPIQWYTIQKTGMMILITVYYLASYLFNQLHQKLSQSLTLGRRLHL
jgi:hypothetical protein